MLPSVRVIAATATSAATLLLGACHSAPPAEPSDAGVTPAAATGGALPTLRPDLSALPRTHGGPNPAARPSAVAAAKSRLELLADYMQGSFDSAQQAAEDAAFFDIRLHMVRIWPERTDGIWLYVEQAMAQKPDAPYRQRVYRLSQRPDGAIVSAAAELPGTPEQVVDRYTGAWKDASKLAGVTPDQIKPRQGCEIVLTYRDGAFVGSTDGRNCLSELRGATYATTITTITPDSLVTWDRGFDDTGKQVWGAVKGGYVFRKQPDGSRSAGASGPNNP